MCIDRVVGQGFQGKGRREVLHSDVPGIEPVRGFGFRQDIVIDLPAADEDRIDAEVDGAFFLLYRIFRGERIYYELEIRGAFRRFPVQPCLKSEELHAVDADLPMEKGGDFYLGREARHLEQLVVLLVFQGHVLHDNPVEKP